MAQPLAGKTILVAEDDYFQAADLKRALIEAGATVVGPVADVDGAMALVAAGRLDAAVLDVNLSSTLSYPLADRLAADAIPYVFLTGYDVWALPEAYRSVPRLSKPCLMDSVVVMVGRLMTGAEAC
ncbi:CheY-like chemotaxis protein [Sphingomonas jinjuensis]|uniref:CheY-like chemotaxis protein n=1 Tax=Sphingomonas jinjuensis TaxID=535907 RepID=A0A840F3G1_9SPHN|nr:response regulator [Sphingomonas jinjuensis]MBB4153873.1 CheY-like chemotaxis protein [Sphingomonas jinjuensis]